jgi:hypothetical protein
MGVGVGEDCPHHQPCGRSAGPRSTGASGASAGPKTTGAAGACTGAASAGATDIRLAATAMAHPAVPTPSFVTILVMMPTPSSLRPLQDDPLLGSQTFIRPSTESAKSGRNPLVNAVSGSGWMNRDAVGICQSSFQIAETADGTGLRTSLRRLHRRTRSSGSKATSRRAATVRAV